MNEVVLDIEKIGTLMLIDDNNVDQMLYKRVIDRSGLVHHLEQFVDARMALQKLREGLKPDAILLDINMPGMNGFDFLENAIAEFGDDFSVVVVMLTTSMNPDDSSRAARYSVVKDYLSKPLKTEQLIKISRLIKP